MPNTRSDIFRNVRIENDFDIERVFLHNTKSGFEITLDGKIRGLLERLAGFFQAFDALDGKRPDLLILLHKSEQVQPTAKIHQPVWMDRVVLLLLAVDGEVLHVEFNFFSYGLH